MTQHEQVWDVRVVRNYNMDTLGAPFRVILIDGAKLKKHVATGREEIEIPDVCGLINAVVRARVVHPRKMNGQEIKFIRNALGVKARPLAKFLDISPEHLSRCEAASKIMSATDEKMLRLFAFLATLTSNPSALLAETSGATDIKMKEAKPEKALDDLLRLFFSMKIEPLYDAADKLEFEFVRIPAPEVTENADDQGNWAATPDAAPRMRACG